jgi:CRP/FNR family cyclic AMP-dependent transcriptional regulator
VQGSNLRPWHDSGVVRSVHFPILDALDDDERRVVLGEARRRRFARGEVVFHAGDPADSLHLISTGRVLVRRSSPTGEMAILAFLGPGEFFGELALLGRDPPLARNATIQTVELTETLSIRADRFAEIRRHRPGVDRFLVELLAARVSALDDLLVEALLVPAETRVLRRLLALADHFAPDSSGVTAVPLTQDELASIAGTSRATANRALRTAATAGLLRLARSRVEILDHEGLVRRAG